MAVEEEKFADASKTGLVFVVVGFLIFALGTPLRPEWFIQNNYLLNAPVAILVTFLVIGAFFTIIHRINDRVMG